MMVFEFFERDTIGRRLVSNLPVAVRILPFVDLGAVFNQATLLRQCFGFGQQFRMLVEIIASADEADDEQKLEHSENSIDGLRGT